MRGADLDADGLRDRGRAAEPRREVDLAEAALAEQPLDPVAEAGLGADDHLVRHEQVLAPVSGTWMDRVRRVVLADAVFG